jgi:hypothetical protein
MPRRSKALLDRADRLHDAELPEVFLIIGAPEAVRLYPTKMNSEAEAVVGGEYFAAADGESVKQFHARMAQIARDRGARVVMVGAAPTLPSRFNLDGSPVTVN